MPDGDERFPFYTVAEKAADRTIHLVGVPAAIGAAIWLIAKANSTSDLKLTVTLLVYGCALIATFAMSAAYNLSRPGDTKERLRRVDHAMIYVMIAASYTPFAVNVLPRHEGAWLCTGVWLMAAVGVGMKLIFPRRFERLSLLLYLGMGWSALSMINTFIALLPRSALLLLLLGGAAYTLGALIHSLQRVPFQNVVWHVMVLVGAGLHLAAVAILFA